MPYDRFEVYIHEGHIAVRGYLSPDNIRDFRRAYHHEIDWSCDVDNNFFIAWLLPEFRRAFEWAAENNWALGEMIPQDHERTP